MLGCSSCFARTHTTCSLRGIPPAETEQFALAHDVATWRCFTRLLGISGVGDTQDWASLPDSLKMINSRHPGVAATRVKCLVGPTESRHFSAAASCRAVLRESGFDAPEWETLLTSLPRALAALPGALAVPEQGWQHVASLVVEERFVNTVVVPHASPAHRAMLRSQSGPLSGLPFTTLPLLLLQRFDSHLFRVLLLRRLHLPLPLSSRACRCGRLLDCLGHHRASCLRAGVLGRRGFALESAVAQVLPRGRRQSLSECVLARPRPAHWCHGPTPDRGDR